MMRYIIFGILLLSLPFSCFAQFFETRQLISINAGYGVLNGAEDNVFFPSSANQSGLKLDLSYGHQIKSWLDGGVSIGFNQFESLNANTGFAEISSTGSTFFTIGPQVVVHSPFKTSGLFNRIRVGLALAPQYNYYSGVRSLAVDNEIVPRSDAESYVANLEMDESSSGFGAKFSPELNCRITQRFGLKVNYDLQLLNVSSGYGKEMLIATSVSGGFIFTFGNHKSLF